MFRNRVFRSTNPVYTSIERNAETSSEAVTRQGVGIKTMILLLLAIASGIGVALGMKIDVAGQQIAISDLSKLLLGLSVVFVIIGMIGTWLSINPIFAIIYSVGYGATLGAISMMAEAFFPGVVLLAVVGTVSIFFAMMSLYNLGVIKVTEKFRAVVMGMFFGYFIFALVIWILSFFMGGISETFFGANSVGIAIGAFAVLLGALMLVLDFDAIEQFANNGVDKKYEWRLAFGLTITILWIYVELLKLFIRIMASQRR